MSYKLSDPSTICSLSQNSNSFQYLSPTNHHQLTNKEPIFPDLNEDYQILNSIQKSNSLHHQTNLHQSPINLDCKSNTTYYNLSSSNQYYSQLMANQYYTSQNNNNNTLNNYNGFMSQNYTNYIPISHNVSNQTSNNNNTTNDSTGMNASWSTPSPPTNGSSSLFNDPRSGFVHTPVSSIGLSPLSKISNFNWSEGPLTSATSFPAQNLNLGGYQMVQHQDDDSNQFKSTNSSLFMSSSTPVSNLNYYHQYFQQQNEVNNKLFLSRSPCETTNELLISNRQSIGLNTCPIPFYLHSSDSSNTTTHTENSQSGTSNNLNI